MSVADSLIAGRWKKPQREPTNREKNGNQALPRYDHAASLGAIEEVTLDEPVSSSSLITIVAETCGGQVERYESPMTSRVALTSHKRVPTRVPSVNVLCIYMYPTSRIDNVETHEN